MKAQKIKPTEDWKRPPAIDKSKGAKPCLAGTTAMPGYQRYLKGKLPAFWNSAIK